jgi:hypothetical protein
MTENEHDDDDRPGPTGPGLLCDDDATGCDTTPLEVDAAEELGQ